MKRLQKYSTYTLGHPGTIEVGDPRKSDDGEFYLVTDVQERITKIKKLISDCFEHNDQVIDIHSYEEFLELVCITKTKKIAAIQRTKISDSDILQSHLIRLSMLDLSKATIGDNIMYCLECTVQMKANVACSSKCDCTYPKPQMRIIKVDKELIKLVDK